jgi:hypothetical protein
MAKNELHLIVGERLSEKEVNMSEKEREGT